MAEENPSTQSVPKGKVLIADDDEDFRTLLVRRAKRMGLSIVEVDSGTRAMEAIAEEDFDAIVLDVYMPGCSGVEVAQAARKKDPDLQVIVLTGSATLETAIEALRIGVHDYLPKPLESLEAFELVLTRALEYHHLLKENARLFAEVQRLAMTDPLTGLYNRHKLSEVIETEMERSRRYGRSLSLVMVDLDGLKRVNDTLGHPVGDAVLQAAAQAIRGAVRRVDLPTRIGGDEFLILLPEADLKEAARVAWRIFNNLAPLSVQGERVSASAGVAQWRPAHVTSSDFLRAVDQALYQAKRAGGRHIAVVGHEAEGGSENVNEWQPEVAHV